MFGIKKKQVMLMMKMVIRKLKTSVTGLKSPADHCEQKLRFKRLLHQVLFVLVLFFIFIILILSITTRVV